MEPNIDEEAYRRLGDQLLASWRNDAQTAFHAKRANRAWSSQQLACVHSLASHVHRLYVPAARLLDDDWVTEAMPLVRTAYQCALTAQWIAQSRDGANAFMNEDVRQRRSLEQTAQRGLPASVKGDQSVPGIDLEMLETSAAASARNFEQLCRDLAPGGDNAYFAYRVLSAYAHPSVALVDEYLLPNDQTGIPTLLREPKPKETRGAWRGVLVSTLVWSGRAVDYFDGDKARRSELRSAAKALGITSELHLTPEAERREAAQRFAKNDA